MFLAEVKVEVSWARRFQQGAGYVAGCQQSQAVPLAPERRGKVTHPSLARLVGMGISLWVSVSWDWGLSRGVVDKDVPEFSRGMVSGIKSTEIRVALTQHQNCIPGHSDDGSSERDERGRI